MTAPRSRRMLLLLALATSLLTSPAAAQVNTLPRDLAEVGVTEHLGARVPRDVNFITSDRRPVTLGHYFDGRRPVVLNLVYHRCPMLCGMVLNAVIRALSQTQWTVGDQFQAVTISIDPRDTPEVAAQKRRRTLEAYGRAGAENGWHFLTGSDAEVRRVADAVGFRYRFDPREDQYAHAAVTILLTPDGRVARYLYGIDYKPVDVRVGLLEASQGRTINTIERLILYCYHYDPEAQGYVLVARRVMQVGGVITMLALGGLLGTLWWRERRKRAIVAASTPPTSSNDTDIENPSEHREGT